MIIQTLMALACAIILWHSFRALMAIGPKTKPGITAGWLMVSFGSFGVLVSPLFMPAVIPLLPVLLLIFGESAIVVFSRRAIAQ